MELIVINVIAGQIEICLCDPSTLSGLAVHSSGDKSQPPLASGGRRRWPDFLLLHVEYVLRRFTIQKIIGFISVD